MDANWLDITVLIIIIVFMIIGLFRGFVRQVFSILAIAGGIIVAMMFFDLMGGVLVQKQYLQNHSVANVIGFILIMLVSYIIIQLLGWIVIKLIGTLQLNWADRLGGGVLGGVFALILCIVLIAGLTFFYGEDDPVFKNSLATPYLKTAYLLIKDSMPNDMDEEFHRARKLIRKKGVVAAAKVKEIVVEKEKDKKPVKAGSAGGKTAAGDKTTNAGTKK
ncbi:MAG: hypothetical protein GTN99_06270 [Candidatus Dadabacteria bacterium]|nr:hypothetical protein [Candidatus Dadabacteria bacterium]